MKSDFSFENGMLSFNIDEGIGWSGICFELNGELTAGKSVSRTAPGIFTVKSQDRTETFSIEHLPGKHILTVSRKIRNDSDRELEFLSLSDGLLSPDSQVNFAPLPAHYAKAQFLRYFYSGNLRVEKFPEFRPDYPYIRVLPSSPVHFNHCEANNIPAFGICDSDFRYTIVEADLLRTRFSRSWKLGLRGKKREIIPGIYQGIIDYPLTNRFLLAPGEEVEVSRVFYQIQKGTHPQQSFRDYIDYLSEHEHMYGKKSAMLHGAVYCTWNYGVFDNITEDTVIKRAQVLRETLPGCTHFLIDDGYQANRNDRNAGFCSFYPDPALGANAERFPKGMKFVADSLREMGLVPSIWLSPKIYLDSDLAREKPEWLLKDLNGSPEIIDQTTFLDLSHPEARAFFLKIIDTLFVDWGFQGIKFDFMTQWFLLDKIRYGSGSGLEWQDFVFSEIRKRIGEEGLFMTCIAMSMGNPFLGRYADAYRSGCDIHDSTWMEQLRACKATLPQILQEGRKTLLLNMDSVGIGKIPENEIYFRFNWVFITQGIIEIGGKMEELDRRQLGKLQKLLSGIDRGHRVSCPDERAFTGDGLPEILRVDYPEDSRSFQNGIRSHIAFFNWSERKKILSLEVPESNIIDFWNGSSVKAENGMISAVLEPHSSAMYALLR